MNKRRSPAESMETFVLLCRSLSDPFANRSVLLAELGLDDAAFGVLLDRWTSRLRVPEGEALLREFEDTYSEARRAGTAQQQAGGAPKHASVHLAPDVLPVPLPRVKPRGAEPHTAVPDLPSFMRDEKPGLRAPPIEREAPVPAHHPAADRRGETMDIDVAVIARRVLAFNGPAPPGKRWKRFDPQTGQPLAAPVLEDLPASPSDPGASNRLHPGIPASASEDKALPRAPSQGETVELDADLLAAALKSGSAPFFKPG